MHLSDRELAHDAELGAQRLVREPDQRAGHARDSHCVVAHSLELRGDVLDAHQVAEVAGHRLLGRYDHEDLLADLPEELVEVLVLRAHLLRRTTVAPAKSIEGGFDLRFDQRSHANQRLAQARELLFESQSGHAIAIRTGR